MMTRTSLRDQGLALVLQFLKHEGFAITAELLMTELGEKAAEEIERIPIRKPLLSLLNEAGDLEAHNMSLLSQPLTST